MATPACLQNAPKTGVKDSELIIGIIIQLIHWMKLNGAELRQLEAKGLFGEYVLTNDFAVVHRGQIICNFEINVWQNWAYLMLGKSRRTPYHSVWSKYRWVPTSPSALETYLSPTRAIVEGNLYELTDL